MQLQCRGRKIQATPAPAANTFENTTGQPPMPRLHRCRECPFYVAEAADNATRLEGNAT